MITITVSTPDRTLVSVEADPNELDALRQTILLGLDYANDAGLATSAASLLAASLSIHC